MRRLVAAFALLVAMTACVGPSTPAEAPRARTEPTGATMADGDFPMLLGMIARCGSTIDVRVSARSNIFGAGIAERPDPAGGGGGVSPVCVPVPRSVTTMILETVRGGVSFSSHPGFSDGAQGSFFHRCSFGTDAKVRVVIRADGATTDACGAAAGLGGAIDPAGLVSGINVARPDRLPRRRLPARRAGYVPATVRPSTSRRATSPSDSRRSCSRSSSSGTE